MLRVHPWCTSAATILFWWLLAAFPSSAGTFSGRVVGVSDGDTITVLDDSNQQHKIRLAGCDAPEKRQPFGERSKQHLSDLLFDHQVIASCYKMDRYGREICRVYVDSRDACLEQVRAGLAWHYKRYEREQTPEERAAFADLEEEARRQGHGLWRDPNVIPPWEYRRAR